MKQNPCTEAEAGTSPKDIKIKEIKRKIGIKPIKGGSITILYCL